MKIKSTRNLALIHDSFPLFLWVNFDACQPRLCKLSVQLQPVWSPQYTSRITVEKKRNLSRPHREQRFWVRFQYTSSFCDRIAFYRLNEQKELLAHRCDKHGRGNFLCGFLFVFIFIRIFNFDYRKSNRGNHHHFMRWDRRNCIILR